MCLRESIIVHQCVKAEICARMFPDIIFIVQNLIFFYKDSNVSLLQVDAYIHVKKFLQHLSSCLNLIISLQKQHLLSVVKFFCTHIFNNVYMIKYKLYAIYFTAKLYLIYMSYTLLRTINVYVNTSQKYFETYLKKNLNYPFLVLTDRLLFRCLILLPVFLSEGHASCP